MFLEGHLSVSKITLGPPIHARTQYETEQHNFHWRSDYYVATLSLVEDWLHGAR